MGALCAGRVRSVLIGLHFALSLRLVVAETAGENSILVGSNPPLVQDEPGNKPGGLEQEDAGQTYRGVDTERLQSRHVLKNQEFRYRMDSSGNHCHLSGGWIY